MYNIVNIIELLQRCNVLYQISWNYCSLFFAVYETLVFYNFLKKASPLNFPRNFERIQNVPQMWYEYVVCGNYERLLLATHHGLACAFRCQLFIGVHRLELEIREIHGQDAALVEAECTQSNVAPAVMLKYERNVSVSEDKCARRGRILSPEWEGRSKDRFPERKQVWAKDPTNRAPTSLDSYFCGTSLENFLRGVPLRCDRAN